MEKNFHKVMKSERKNDFQKLRTEKKVTDKVHRKTQRTSYSLKK